MNLTEMPKEEQEVEQKLEEWSEDEKTPGK